MNTKTIAAIAAVLIILGAGYAVAKPANYGFWDNMMGSYGNGMMGSYGIGNGYGHGMMGGYGGMMNGYYP